MFGVRQQKGHSENQNFLYKPENSVCPSNVCLCWVESQRRSISVSLVPRFKIPFNCPLETLPKRSHPRTTLMRCLEANEAWAQIDYDVTIARRRRTLHLHKSSVGDQSGFLFSFGRAMRSDGLESFKLLLSTCLSEEFLQFNFSNHAQKTRC